MLCGLCYQKKKKKLYYYYHFKQFFLLSVAFPSSAIFLQPHPSTLPCFCMLLLTRCVALALGLYETSCAFVCLCTRIKPTCILRGSRGKKVPHQALGKGFPLNVTPRHRGRSPFINVDAVSLPHTLLNVSVFLWRVRAITQPPMLRLLCVCVCTVCCVGSCQCNIIIYLWMCECC